MELIAYSFKGVEDDDGDSVRLKRSPSTAAVHLCSTWWFLVRPSVPAGRTGSDGSSLLPPPQSQTRSESKNKSPLRLCRHLKKERRAWSHREQIWGSCSYWWGFFIILFIYFSDLYEPPPHPQCIVLVLRLWRNRGCVCMCVCGGGGGWWWGGHLPVVGNWKAPTSSGQAATSAFFNQPQQTLIIQFEILLT